MRFVKMEWAQRMNKMLANNCRGAAYVELHHNKLRENGYNGANWQDKKIWL
jgi:hypothetical protein